MAILGSGEAHGACSLLHAAGTGYGSSIALDLPVAVRLLDKPSKRELKDPDGLLDAVIQVWMNNGYNLPKLIYYNIRTDIDLSIDVSERLVHIVGYEERLLDRVYSENWKIDTSEDEFNRLKTDDRYFGLMSIIESIDEI